MWIARNGAAFRQGTNPPSIEATEGALPLGPEAANQVLTNLAERGDTRRTRQHEDFP